MRKTSYLDVHPGSQGLATYMTLQWFENNPAFCVSRASEIRHSLLEAGDGLRLVLHGYIVDEVKSVRPGCIPWATEIDPDWQSNTREIRDSDPDWAFHNLDALFQTTMPKETLDAIFEFEEKFLALTPSAYGDEEAALKAHFATLTAELPNTHHGVLPWTMEIYHSWKRHYVHQEPRRCDALEYWRRGGDRTAIIKVVLAAKGCRRGDIN